MLGLVARAVEERLSGRRLAELDLGRTIALDASNGLVDGTCFLLFDGGSAEPSIVAKVARTAAGRTIYEAEHGTLVALHAAGMNEGAASTPVPLGRWRAGEALVTLQSALPGTLLKNLPGRRLFGPTGFDAIFDHVVAWWERLLSKTGVARATVTEDRYERHVLAPLRRYRARFVVDPRQRGFLRERLERGQVLAGLELPWMVRHGDFCTANMVRGPGGTLGVFDWEFPLDPGLPLFDLLYFFSSLRFPFGGRRGESSHHDSFLAVWWGDEPLARAARRRVAEAGERHGVPREAIGDLLLVALIEVALLKYDSLLDRRGIAPDGVPREETTDAEKLAAWARVGPADPDVPFCRIEDGAAFLPRSLAERGMPAF